jgi:hypothetical protein
VTGSARTLKQPPAVLDVRCGVLVLRGRCSRDEEESQNANQNSHGAPSLPRRSLEPFSPRVKSPCFGYSGKWEGDCELTLFDVPVS